MANREPIGETLNRRRPDGLKPDDSSYRILVCDDSLAMRKMIEQMLRSEAYDIVGEAENGAQAIERYRELKPDLVTMDYNMPVLDGLQALEKIIAFDAGARVVMLTADGSKARVVEAITRGARNYVIKPPDRKDLLEKVKFSLK